ncbi:hypothetical protein F5Y10DRAFT_255466 [Nemania abortiva]|nr:hypothetical protein F5Y10DRAFT_255466 [Nemania abortiva]
MYWHTIPQELRIMVLESLVLLESDGGRTSPYAAVSKEWQAFFEKQHFGRLVLHQSHIREFDRIVRHQRRRMVRHIWLRIQLAEYDCDRCYKRENDAEARVNNQLMTEAIWTTLKVLSTWPKRGRFGVGNKGPILELSVHSPSDIEHHFHNYLLDSNFYAHSTNEDCSGEEFCNILSREQKTRRTSADTHAQRYGYNGKLASGADNFLSSFNAAIRIDARLLTLDFGNLGPGKKRVLPSAKVVRGLLIRRQSVRQFSLSTLLEIVRRLPEIEIISLESWQPMFIQIIDAGGMLDRFSGPTSLKTLSIFRGYNPVVSLRAPYSIDLGQALADGTNLVEHLSIAFLIDSNQFFHDFRPKNPDTIGSDIFRSAMQRNLMSQLSPLRRRRLMEKKRKALPRSFDYLLLDEFKAEHGSIPIYQPSWPCLKSLALTSHTLNPTASGDELNAIFISAATAAMEMPQLQTMEIWNATRSSLCIFRYRRTGSNGRPMITLISSWGLILGPQVVSSWNDVTRKYFDEEVRVEEQTAAGEVIDTYATVIDLLELRQLVCHQISICQMRYEAEYRNRIIHNGL